MADETCVELDCCPPQLLQFRTSTSSLLLAENNTGVGVPVDGYTLLTEDSLEIKT
jgi:hypothetical protein